MAEFEQRFLKFDAENPQVWEMFKAFALEAISYGHKRLSSRRVVSRVRWETMMTGSDFKPNDNFTPHYSKKFMAEFPQYDGFFKLRDLP